MVMRLGSKAEGADFFRMVIERDDLWRDLESSHIVLQGPVRLEELLVQRLSLIHISMSCSDSSTSTNRDRSGAAIRA